jgi:voltage-gated potassium channel
MAFADIFLNLPEEISDTIHSVDTVFSIIFLGDFFLRLYLSTDRRYYFRTHWIDFFSSIPLVEAFRFGRILRLVRLVRIMRLRRVLHWLHHTFGGFDQLSNTLQNNLLQRSIMITAALLVFGAFMITWLEGPADPVKDFEQSLWWSFATVVTGGFADIHNPTSGLGRVVTVGLVLLGLTVTGIFTASLTSVLVEDDATRMEQSQHNIEQQLSLVDQKLNLLSGKTNEGLIALETVAQTISNPTTSAAVATAVCQNLIDHFDVQQASVHRLVRATGELKRLAGLGAEGMMPAFSIPVGKGMMGELAQTLDVADVASQDLEPFTAPYLPANGMRMVCPMVAMGQLVGFIHVVLPEDAGRFFLYNRVPMTLAHQLAMSLHLVNGQQ